MTNDDKEPIIILENVKKHYVQGTTVIRALDGIDLKLKGGTFTAIVGPSGCGKSTLLNIIGLIATPTSGSLKLMGKDIASVKESMKCSYRRDIGNVFQAFNLIDSFTALENVALALVAKNMKKKERYEKARQVLKEIGLGDRVDHYPYKLSGGEQQRVAIARAVAVDPIVILADEPTGNLDKARGREILDIFHRLNKDDNQTILFVTHDHDIANNIGSIVYMEDGRIIDDGA